MPPRAAARPLSLAEQAQENLRQTQAAHRRRFELSTAAATAALPGWRRCCRRVAAAGAGRASHAPGARLVVVGLGRLAAVRSDQDAARQAAPGRLAGGDAAAAAALGTSTRAVGGLLGVAEIGAPE